MSLSLSTEKGEATAKPMGEGGGKLPLFPRRERRRSLAAAQAPLCTALQFLRPPPSPTPTPGPGGQPYKMIPSLTRTRSSNAIFLNNHFRVKGGLPESPLPPPLHRFVLSLAGARQRRRRRMEARRARARAFSAVREAAGPRTGQARASRALIYTGEVTEAKVLFATPVLLDLWRRGFFSIARLSPHLTQAHYSAPPWQSPSFPDSTPRKILLLFTGVEKQILGDPNLKVFLKRV